MSDAIVQLIDREHARQQSEMYIGSKTPMTAKEFIPQANGTLLLETVTYAHAAYKCYDEINVNGIDQWVKAGGYVIIYISINREEKSFTIKNTYTCIPVEKTKNSQGVEMYMPQMAFGEFRAGSNFNHLVKLTGGTFGFGASLCAAFSDWLKLTTVDAKQGLKYEQTFRDCLKTIEPPIITPTAEKQYTEVTCKLNWSDFKMNGHNSELLLDTFYKLIHLRAIHTAAYISPQPVYWNGERIYGVSPMEMARMHVPNASFIRELKLCTTPKVFDKQTRTFKWQVAVAVHKNGKFGHVSLVNGVYTKGGGSQIDLLKDQLVEGIKKDYGIALRKYSGNKTAKFPGPDAVLKYLFIYAQCEINFPSFAGNRKDQIENDIKDFDGIEFPIDYIKDIWKNMEHLVIEDVSIKSDKKAKKKTKTKAKKYVPAQRAGTMGNNCTLFIAEGDSATGTLDKMICSKESKLSYVNYGWFSIQGVPVNIRKETKIEQKGPLTIKTRLDKYTKNERIQALIQVLDLALDKTYTKKDIEKLPYAGGIIIATDQDIDGTGNIRSLILNIFQTEWPSLIKESYVKFMITPIIRAYPKTESKVVKEFWSEQEFREWKSANDLEGYDIHYYKGIAGHSNEETANMAKNFERMVIPVYSDKDCEELCERYFGKSAELRRKALRNLPTGQEQEFVTAEGIALSDHLETSTHKFQLKNIERHLVHVLDGFTPTSRKILCGARAKFAKSNQKILVYQLTGFVTENMGYHQGDSSASNVAINMAQCFPGAKEFPLLRALSHFGSRKKGGEDAGHPRYIYTKYNSKLANALFPREDDQLLEYELDDNKRYEPKYYVPIVPLSILEHNKTPATGWQCLIFARDYTQVFDHVEHCINTDAVEIKTFDPASCGLDFKLETIGSKLWSVGKWRQVAPDTIVVEALPLRKWNSNLIEGKAKKKTVKKEEKKTSAKLAWNDDPNIVKVFDRSSPDMETDIEISFRTGFLDELRRSESKDGCQVIKYLGLRQSMSSNINFMNIDGSVLELGENYGAVFKTWFPIRRELYSKRIEREKILLELKIQLNQEKIRFAGIRDGLKLSRKKESEQIAIVTEQKFTRFDSALLDKPGYTPVAQLRELILNGPKASVIYLLKMNDLQRNEDGIAKLHEKIKDWQSQLAELNQPGTIQRTWLKELNELREIVRLGKSSGAAPWTAWDKKFRFST